MEGIKLLQWLASASFFANLIILMVTSANASVPALFVFGDSTVDSGTNNYINTSNIFRGDFPPYGQDFFKKPTGRYSNGRIIIDFIAEYAGLPFIPPYLEPHADHSHGANFASGGCGVLATINAGLVVDFQEQLSQFLLLKAKVTKQHGQAIAEDFFSDSVYIMNIGSNDYLEGYLVDSKLREIYNLEQFVDTVVTGIVKGIKVLYTAGARKVVLFDLEPLGCLPYQRAEDENGNCIAPVSAVAAAHNVAMTEALSQLKQLLPRLTIVQAHAYEFLKERVENPSKYGFVNGDKPCCGAGPCEGVSAVFDDQLKQARCETCPNANEYIFWDPSHTSESLQKQFAEVLWKGTASSPVGLEKLFKQKAVRQCAEKLDPLLVSHCNNVFLNQSFLPSIHETGSSDLGCSVQKQ